MTDALRTLRHTAAELLAISVSSLFPKAQLVSGEATSLGFYYDFFFPETITVEQLPFIEERMRDFIRQRLPIKIMEMMRKNAVELFKHHRQDLKVALLKENMETLVHVCQIGQFYDLAYPPFVETTQEIGAIKLTEVHSFVASLPGRPNLTLTRIQGTAFPDSSSLKQFLKLTEGAKERDHRLLGKAMGLFTVFEDACPGCWSWSPKGTILRETLFDWWRLEHQKQGYQLVSTSNVFRPAKIDTKTFLRFDSQGTSYLISSTKAPGHALTFKSKLHSYRELPIRYCELDVFYEQEKEVHLWGLLRARSYWADSAFIFCRPEQVLEELISSLQFIERTFKIFGFETHWHLIGKNSNSKKVSRNWDDSQESLLKALAECGLSHTLEKDEKASYGPILEMRFSDAFGRKWKGSYVYIDLHHRSKYALHYQELNGQMAPPVMIGRAMFGSLERLIAILIEHYAGELPVWLMPEQVRVIPVTDKQSDYAKQVYSQIKRAGFRLGIDYRKENLGVKIHASETEKVPYLVVVGDKEEKSKTISLRRHGHKEALEGMALEDFLSQLHDEVEMKVRKN